MKRIILFLLATLLAALPLCAAAEGAGPYAAVMDLNGARIGVQTGTTFDEIVLDALLDRTASYAEEERESAKRIRGGE